MEIGTYQIKSLTRTLQKCQSHSVDCRPFLRFWSVNSPGISPDLESERSLQPPQDSFGIVRFFPSPSEPRIVPRIARLAQNPHQTGNGFRKIGGLSDRPSRRKSAFPGERPSMGPMFPSQARSRYPSRRRTPTGYLRDRKKRVYLLDLATSFTAPSRISSPESTRSLVIISGGAMRRVE